MNILSQARVCGDINKNFKFKKEREEKRMRMKRFARVFTSAMLAGAMMMTMGGMTAFAEPDDESTQESPNPKNVTVDKWLTKEKGVYAPMADFTFSVEAIEETTGAVVKNGDKYVKVTIPENGVTISADEKISSNPATAGHLEDTRYKVGSLDLVIAKQFPAPGVYRYKITENTENPESNKSYEGIKFDSTEKFFDVYVGNDNVPYAYTFVNEDGKEKTDGAFYNGYGYKSGPDNPDPTNDVNSLTIKKVVDGNQGNLSEEFSFTIEIDGANGEMYHVTYSDPERKATDITNGSTTIFLKSDESATVSGLSATDKYIVTENIDEKEGYTTTIAIGGEEIGNTTTTGNEGRTISKNTEIIITNYKQVSTPTGIVLSFAPYIMLVALAGVFAVLFLRKKKEEF